MRILTFTQIGSHHSNHNEDAFATAELSDDHSLIALINGSAAGEKGYFTAALAAQLLVKIASEMALRNFAEKERRTTAQLLRDCTKQLFTELGEQRGRLHLAETDLQLTLNLGVIDERARNAEFVVVGSGVVSCDGDTIEFAQYAQPDYLGKHAGRKGFKNWWASHDKRVSCENCLDVSIATPGILTFEAFSHDSFRPVTEDELIAFLLTERNDGPVEQLFRRKMLYIEDKFGLIPTDDISIIRAFIL